MSELHHLSDIQFKDLQLPESLLSGVKKAGFTHCTPIQAESLPLALEGKDVAGQAQTGTGKTAAFLLAMANYLMKHPASSSRKVNQPRALILSPTRELAIQIHKDACQLLANTDFTLGLVYGGTGYESQRKQLQDGVDVLIGTPGRIIDYFKQRVFNLKCCQVMVLDEADRMFDLGFISDVRYLLRGMMSAEERLNMLFSATLSYRVIELAYEHMNNPEIVKVESENVTADKVTQRVYYTANNEKIPLLIGLLSHMDPRRSIVFVNTKRVAERVWAYLEGNGFNSAILSGDVPQNKRQQLLTKFQQGELPVLVATDVAARGLHIPDVSHIFNFDLPQDAEDYVHRIGRTARAGASGDAISFACEDYTYSLPEIEAYINNKIPMEQVSSEMLADLKPPVKIKRKAGPHKGKGGPRSGQRHSPNRSNRQHKPR